MSGYTEIKLNGKGVEKISEINARLRELISSCNSVQFYRVSDINRFYNKYKSGICIYDLCDDGDDDQKIIYNGYLHSCKVNSLNENPYMIGLYWYFGRTSQNVLRSIGKVLGEFPDCIASLTGSSEEFMERSMSKREQNLILKHSVRGIEYKLTSTVYSKK